jgi:hypothetical protein
MSVHQQLEKFHRHLLAIEQAGFDLQSQLLLDSNVDPRPVDTGAEEPSLLAAKLAQVFENIDHKQGQELGLALAGQSGFKPIYSLSFHQWLADEEQISSLEHLLIHHHVERKAQFGLSQTRLLICIHLFFGACALAVVWGSSHQGVREMVDQLGVVPTGLLGSLLNAKLHWAGLVTFVVASVVFIGWLVTRVASNRLLEHAKMVEQVSSATIVHEDTNAQTSPSQSPARPLLEWALHVAPAAGLDPEKVLKLTKRMCQRIGVEHSTASSARGAWMISTSIGGLIALGTGLLLFYPLAQLLKMVVASQGSMR